MTPHLAARGDGHAHLPRTFFPYSHLGSSILLPLYEIETMNLKMTYYYLGSLGSICSMSKLYWFAEKHRYSRLKYNASLFMT